MAKTKRRGFVYKPRTKEQIGKRAKQQGGMYDSPYLPSVVMFVPKEGDHRIRVLPPTWDDAEHYGFDVWLHSGIGPDNQTYLCPAKMDRGPCPVCEEQARAAKAGEEEYAGKLKPYRRVALYVLVRGQEADGPMLYPMPWTLDRDVTNLSIEKDTGEILCVDNPEDGWDVEFTKQGSGMTTKYHSAQIARRSTPMLPDEDEAQAVLDHIMEHPIPEMLNFYPYEHMAKVFAGAAKATDVDDEDDDEEERKPRTRAASKARVSKATPADADEIDDEDEDLDDDVEDGEDEDETPVITARAPKKKAKVIVEDDDDEDEDLEDEDDEDLEDDEDEPAPVARRSSVKDQVRAGLRKRQKR